MDNRYFSKRGLIDTSWYQPNPTVATIMGHFMTLFMHVCSTMLTTQHYQDLMQNVRLGSDDTRGDDAFEINSKPSTDTWTCTHVHVHIMHFLSNNSILAVCMHVSASPQKHNRKKFPTSKYISNPLCYSLTSLVHRWSPVHVHACSVHSHVHVCACALI